MECIKLSVQIKFSLCASTLILLCGAISIASGQTSASCASPPGKISCEGGQAAICDATSGQFEGYCKTPASGKSLDELRAWVLEYIFGAKISAQDVLQNPQYQLILEKGEVTSGGRRITFQLPVSSNSTDPAAHVPSPVLHPDPTMTLPAPSDAPPVSENPVLMDDKASDRLILKLPTQADPAVTPPAPTRKQKDETSSSPPPRP
jgi:hypothetical protein